MTGNKKALMGVLTLGATACLLGMVFTNAAKAADSVASGQSSSTSKSILNHLTASYVGLYTGGPLNDLGAAFSPDTKGNPDTSAPQQVENFLGLFYKLSKTAKIGAQAHFFYAPGNEARGTNKDPVLQVNEGDIFSSGNFKLSGYARAYLPMTQEAELAQRNLRMRFFLTANYDLRNSRVSVGTYAYAQPQLLKPGRTGTTFTGYLGPYVNYQLSPSVALNLLYEMAMTHTAGQGGMLEFNNLGTDLEPGVSWDVTPSLTLNPYLNIYTGDKISMASTSINMLLVGKLF